MQIQLFAANSFDILVMTSGKHSPQVLIRRGTRNGESQFIFAQWIEQRGPYRMVSAKDLAYTKHSINGNSMVKKDHIKITSEKSQRSPGKLWAGSLTQSRQKLVQES